MHKIKDSFFKHEIENRPIVAGNLLRQPFLREYKTKTKLPNADILNDNGVYIGNNQFVTFEMIDLLIEIIRKNVNEGYHQPNDHP